MCKIRSREGTNTSKDLRNFPQEYGKKDLEKELITQKILEPFLKNMAQTDEGKTAIFLNMIEIVLKNLVSSEI